MDIKMYVIFLVLFLIILIFILIFHFKKRCIIKKICSMSITEKCSMLNELVRPFGYLYDHCQDIFSSTLDAWQRAFGFMNAYDVSAPYFGMVYDYQTIYFNYNEKTWLIELWKGQYGINTGCEIGLYHADTIIAPNKYKTTLFQSASNCELLPISVKLLKNDKCIGQLAKPHWWLTIFKVGCFSRPKTLAMEVSVTFPDYYMLTAFYDSLKKTMPEVYISIKHHNTVSFIFNTCKNKYSLWKKLVRTVSMVWCYICCKLFCFVTRPFKNSCDKLLYLYYYLPFIFRKTLNLCKDGRYKKMKKSH